MIRAALVAASMLAATPLAAQDHSAHGEKPSAKPVMDHCAMGHLPPDQCPPKGKPQPAPEPEMNHCAMGHLPPEQCPPKDRQEADKPTAGDMEGMNHASHGKMTDKSVPGAAAEEDIPARAFDGPRHAADAIWGSEAMEPSRQQLVRENGGMTTGMILVERLEARIPTDGGENGYLWDAQGWYGGDINRFVLKTEGEGKLGGALEDAEIQALYSRAIGPFFDLQAGVRFDPEPDGRTHLVVGVQGLAPYMFHVDGALFLSDRGDLTARVEAEYNQMITQRLILQPRIEAEFAAQNIPEREIGAGITKVEPGLRLRYEIAPEFAPYIGIEYEAEVAETADIARVNGEDPDGLKAVIGMRAWF